MSLEQASLFDLLDDVAYEDWLDLSLGHCLSGEQIASWCRLHSGFPIRVHVPRHMDGHYFHSRWTEVPEHRETARLVHVRARDLEQWRLVIDDYQWPDVNGRWSNKCLAQRTTNDAALSPLHAWSAMDRVGLIEALP